MASAPPTIFSPARRRHRAARMAALQRAPDAARFVLDDMLDDAVERIEFVRHEATRALVVGDVGGRLTGWLKERGTDVVAPADPDEERPWPESGFDLAVSLGTLDTVNDLPGALIHLRNALAEGGLAIASFTGSGSLPVLRSIILEADGERPAARVHPMVDVRAGAQLLQRAGWADPVVDSHALRVRYSSLERLVADLREQGMGNVLASPAPPLGKAGWTRALDAFDARREGDGKVTETIEIVTLSGRRPKARF